MTFRNIPEPKNARITYVWIAIRKTGVINHWAVILEIDNGKYYVNTQKESKINSYNGYNIYLDYFYSLKSASEATFKNGNYKSAIFLSKYGKDLKDYDYISWEELYKKLPMSEQYTLFFEDCQNYCRKIVNIVTKGKKTVGWWPIEDGPVYNNTFPTNDQMANEINKIDNVAGRVVVGTLVFANPAYWLAKGIFSIFD